MSTKTQIANALLTKGTADQWPTPQGPPKKTDELDGLGFTLGHGTWVPWPGERATTTINVWRNPAHWDEPGRYGQNPVWQRNWSPYGWQSLDQWFRDIETNRKCVRLPWGPGWGGPGGTQWWTADNGLTIDFSVACTIDGVKYQPGDGYELQSLRPLDELNRWAINARGLADSAKMGDYWCDGVGVRRAGNTPVGSQGPLNKADGRLTPEHLDSGDWEKPIRMVGLNVQWGTGATARQPGWVEHKLASIPMYANDIVLPMGDHPDMIPCFTVFKLDITDVNILKWVTDSGINPKSALGKSKINYAKGLRNVGWILAETGGGWPIYEATGNKNPEQKVKWDKRGVKTEAIANQFGKNLFKYGKVYVP